MRESAEDRAKCRICSPAVVRSGSSSSPGRSRRQPSAPIDARLSSRASATTPPGRFLLGEGRAAVPWRRDGLALSTPPDPAAARLQGHGRQVRLVASVVALATELAGAVVCVSGRSLGVAPRFDGCGWGAEQVGGVGRVAAFAEAREEAHDLQVGASLLPMKARSIVAMTGSGIVTSRLPGATIRR